MEVHWKFTLGYGSGGKLMRVSKQAIDEAKTIRPMVAAALRQLEDSLTQNSLGKAKVSVVVELPKSKQIICLSNCDWQIKVIQQRGDL